MRLFLLLVFIMSMPAFADSTAHCEVVKGIYANSSKTISDPYFETLADVFTINNAKAFTVSLEGKALRFLREDMKVERYTKLIYLQKKRNKVVRAAYMIIDRTPKEAASDRNFYANVIITDELGEGDDLTKVMNLRTFNYNLYCEF